MASGKALRLGIALGDRRAVVVALGKRGAPIAECAVTLSDPLSPPSTEIPRVFGDLKAELEAQGIGSTEGATVEVTLLPPLSDARSLPFPPMRREEVESVLTRDVARYFFGAEHPRVVAVKLPGRPGQGSTGDPSGSLPVLAAAAPLGLLETVLAAARQVGWRCRALTSAHGGWLATAEALKGGMVGAVVAEVDGTIHLLLLEGNHPDTVRQIPTGDLAALAEALGSQPGRALVLASPHVSGTIDAVLSEGGWSTLRDPDGWASAEEVAAARAGSGGLTFLPPSLRAERKRQRRRSAFFMLATAGILVVAAAGVHLWGAHRELAAVQAEREAIRNQVAPLILARDSLRELEARTQTIRSLEESAPVWTRSLVEITETLPRDAYLTSFFASGDTLELEAAAERAGEAIQLLREAGLFEDIRLQGIVDREMYEGESIRETFRLRGRLPRSGQGGGR